MRIIFCITLLVLATLVPWYVLLSLAVVYVALYEGVELLLVAIAIDAFYGAGAVAPLYTVVTLCLLLLAAIAKPRIRFYTTR